MLAAEPGRPRDHARKLLGLLDFTAAASGPEALADTLSVILYSLMGEFAAPGAAILIAEKGALVLTAAKGSLTRRGVPSMLDLAAIPETPVRAEDLAPGHALAPLAGNLYVPIRQRDRAIGLLIVAAKATRRPYSADEIELVRLVASLAGTVAVNHRLWEEIRTTNRRLSRNLFDLHTLFDVSHELNTALDPESIYRVLAQTAMAHVLVSRCAVLLAEDSGLSVVFARGLTLGQREIERLERIGAADGLGPSDGGVPSGALGEILAEAGLERLVPFRAGHATRGFLALGPRQDGRPLANEETEFLSTLGNQALTALDNLRYHRDRAVREQLERELAFARDIQTRLLPARLPETKGFVLATRWEPCFEVGGDYYDAMHTPGGLLLAAGDVSGKNVTAALLMSTLQATIRSLARRADETPATLLDVLNRNLVESTREGKFASFFVAVLDPETGRLTYANAGHNPPLLLSASGTLERLSSGGPVLGIFDDAHFDEATVTLAPGDLLFIYTDGVTEAVDRRDVEFGEERLIELLRKRRSAGVKTLIADVVEAVRTHAAGQHAADDLTVVALERLAGEVV